MVKFVGIICDKCKAIGPGVALPWLDVSDHNNEIQQKARSKGWRLKGLQDLCARCLKPELVKPSQAKFQRSGLVKRTIKAKDEAKTSKRK